MKDRSSRNVFLAILLIAAIYCLTVHFQPPGFWIVDNANKFLQVQAIIGSKFSDFSLPWRGKAFDPSFRFNPLPSPFSVVKDGCLYSIFSPFFALITTAPYLLLGFRGLTVIPILSSLLLLSAVAHISRLGNADCRTQILALLITALATPLWFYSVTFWEHVPATAASTWAVYFFFRATKDGKMWSFATSGGLAAVACFFREEHFLLLVAVALVLGLTIQRVDRWKGLIVFFVSSLVVFAPFIWFQYYAIGNPLGFHTSTHFGSTNGLASHLMSRGTVVYNLLLASHPNPWMSFLMAAPFLLLLGFVSWPDHSRPSGFFFRLVLLLAFLSSLVYVFSSWLHPQPVLFLLDSANSFFVSAPLVALAGSREHRASDEQVRLLRRVVILFIVFYCLVAPKMGTKGIHWGNRFFLPIYPLLSVVIAKRLGKLHYREMTGRFVRVLGILLVLLSFILQGYSILLLYQKARFSFAINEEIRHRKEEVVISTVWWIPQELYSAFFEKAYFYVRDQREYDELLRIIASHGFQRFLVVTQLDPADPKPYGKLYRDKDLGYFSLRFLVISREKPPASAKEN